MSQYLTKTSCAEIREDGSVDTLTQIARLLFGSLYNLEKDKLTEREELQFPPFRVRQFQFHEQRMDWQLTKQFQKGPNQMASAPYLYI